MSGICGIVSLGGGQHSPADLSAMLTCLAQRGPDGSAAWAEGPAALGHALLATTPEALGEAMPLCHSASGCAITADVRLDNRDTLIAALLRDQAGRNIGDGELVLLAYLRWGTACLDHLLGDFAFAIWDAPRQRLFCARDQIGMRPFIYHHAPGTLFAFASQTEAVLAHSGVLNRINEARIADYLEDMEAHDLTSTFYRDLHRLPPAHALVAEGGTLRTWCYWEPASPSPLRLADGRAYAEAFLEVFTQAVRDRLRAPPGKLGSMLSGGMDSGSVTAVAARLLHQSGAPPLPTFSATSGDPDCIETRTIRAAQATAHLAPTDIAIEDFPAYADDLLRLSQGSGEPFDGHMAMVRAVYLAGHRAGVTVMLDGAGGDTALMADDMVAWRLRQGDIGGAWREAAGARRFWGADVSSLKTFADSARTVVVPEWLRSARRRAGAAARQRRRDRDSMVAPALAESVNLAERRAANARHVALTLDGRCTDRRALVTHPYVAAGRERYDRVAAPLGIEPRDPFLDCRVLAFCLSLPPDQVEQFGWPKVILRRAMADLLPETVRWRTGKQHVGGQFEAQLVEHFQTKSDKLITPAMQNWVRADRLALAASPANGELAVATQTSLSYLAWWMSR